MRVLYVFRSIAQWGGIERILVDKMNCLSDNFGVDVYLLTCDQGKHQMTFKLSKRVHHEDLNICFYRQYRYNVLKRMIVLYNMRRKYKLLLFDRLKRICPDLIITTTSDHLDIITKVKGPIPLIVESHSICTRTINYGRNCMFRYIYRSMLLHSISKIEVIVALTEGDAVEWRKYHSNVVVIPNFVHKHEDIKSSLTSKNVIFVGRFDYQKRAQDAILVWKMVRKRHPDYILHIYGDGEMLNEVVSLATSVGGVVVHQPTKDIFDVYKEGTLLISTSLFEPFGLVMAEAMSCGLPVVAFDCDYGPSEFITDNSNGYLVKDRDLQVFADKVCVLIESDKLRYSMGHAALLSTYRYNVDSVMQLWLHFFNSLINEYYNSKLS